MSDGDPPRRGGKRRLTPEERELWRVVTYSVKPLRTLVQADEAIAEVAPEPAPVKLEPKLPARQPIKPAAAAPPPLAPLGRRLRQRVARGGATIDARIDLHGMTQERAHSALLQFLRKAQTDGAKLVLVITGKGARARADGAAERGVLRRLVPQWLALSEFRPLVIGFELAHITHGGEGALYVRVRRSV